MSVSRRNLLRGTGLAGAALVTGSLVNGVSEAFAAAPALVHPGMLHTAADLTRVRASLAAGDAVVTAGWQRLTGNGRSHSTWKPRPLATVVRGGTGQNYSQFYFDVHAAYQNALHWRISGEAAHGDAARDILNAWSRTLTVVTGNADRFLAAGIYGYQLANAAELMRGYPGFDLAAAQTLLRNVFLPLNESFLDKHNDACITNYWANWDLCTVASVMAIGIVGDDRTLFDRAVAYFKGGAGNGAVRNAIPFLHGDLGQWQESGRDQGHTVLGIGLMGAICEMAWNQGVDLYGYDDNRFLKGAEYVARYNLGQDVPFTTYRWGNGQRCNPLEQTVISAASRGQQRPVWESVFHHYVNRRGLAAPNVAAMAAAVRAEGGGGDYGAASTGYDQLGFGTLMFTRPRTEVASARVTSSPTVTVSAGRSHRPAARKPATSSNAAPSPGLVLAGNASGPSLDLAGNESGPIGGHTGGASLLAGVVGATAAAAAGGAMLLRLRTRRKGDHRGPE
jgi:hypothetical protein